MKRSMLVQNLSAAHIVTTNVCNQVILRDTKESTQVRNHSVAPKLVIVSAVFGDFLSISVAPICGEKWGGSAMSLRTLFWPKIWQNSRVEYFLFEFYVVNVVVFQI